MAKSRSLDDVSSLAHDLATRVEALCPHIPIEELAELTTRLASAERAHASVAPFGGAGAEAAPAPPGNRIVRLHGSAGSAIVLPVEGRASGSAAPARLLAWARRQVRIRRSHSMVQ